MTTYQIARQNWPPTFAKVRIDAHVPGRARERLVLPVGDVASRVRVDILLGKAEIDYVYDTVASGRVASDKKVF